MHLDQVRVRPTESPERAGLVPSSEWATHFSLHACRVLPLSPDGWEHGRCKAAARATAAGRVGNGALSAGATINGLPQRPEGTAARDELDAASGDLPQIKIGWVRPHETTKTFLFASIPLAPDRPKDEATSPSGAQRAERQRKWQQLGRKRTGGRFGGDSSS
jgi:hypothetical protein